MITRIENGIVVQRREEVSPSDDTLGSPSQSPLASEREGTPPHPHPVTSSRNQPVAPPSYAAPIGPAAQPLVGRGACSIHSSADTKRTRKQRAKALLRGKGSEGPPFTRADEGCACWLKRGVGLWCAARGINLKQGQQLVLEKYQDRKISGKAMVQASGCWIDPWKLQRSPPSADPVVKTEHVQEALEFREPTPSADTSHERELLDSDPPATEAGGEEDGTVNYELISHTGDQAIYRDLDGTTQTMDWDDWVALQDLLGT